MAVDAGRWLPGRSVFIHPSAIAPLAAAAKADPADDEPRRDAPLTVNLTRAQIEAGPHAHEGDPVTRDMEALLYDYYGWDPYWGASHFGGAALPNAESQIVGDAARRAADAETPPLDGADHLHSVGRVQGL